MVRAALFFLQCCNQIDYNWSPHPEAWVNSLTPFCTLIGFEFDHVTQRCTQHPYLVAKSDGFASYELFAAVPPVVRHHWLIDAQILSLDSSEVSQKLLIHVWKKWSHFAHFVTNIKLCIVADMQVSQHFFKTISWHSRLDWRWLNENGSLIKLSFIFKHRHHLMNCKSPGTKQIIQYYITLQYKAKEKTPPLSCPPSHFWDGNSHTQRSV